MSMPTFSRLLQIPGMSDKATFNRAVLPVDSVLLDTELLGSVTGHP